MGVTVEMWRVRIGLHNQHSGKLFGCSSISRTLFGRTVILIMLILILLMIGNVELNPGPPFLCPVCRKECPSLPDYANHQKIHSCDSNFLYTCPFPLCVHKFKSNKGLVYHFQCNHSQIAKEDSTFNTPPSTSNSFKCQYCSAELRSSYLFCKHSESHISEGLTVCCPLQKFCEKSLSFGAAKSNDTVKEAKKLRTHLSLYHPGWAADSITPSKSKNQSHTPGLVMDESEPESHLHSQPWTGNLEFGSKDEEPNFDPETMERLFGKFYLMLLADFLLPELQVQGIYEQLAIVSELLQTQLKVLLERALKKLNVEDTDITSLLNEIFACDVFYNLHHKDAPGPSFVSEHLRTKYFRENFGFAHPQEVPLDLDPFGEKVVYVPIKETLSLLIKDEVVRDQITKSFERRESTDGYIRDYYHGSVWKKRCDQSQKQIDIFIFQDGFSVTNPLGSAKNLHKLIGVYFTIGNLPPFMRSKLKLIHLVSMFNADLLTNPTYGLECFRPLISELKSLNNEVIDINGVKYPVCVQFFIGDNLGAHVIGGFTGSFNHEYFCRFCERKKTDFLEQPSLVKPLRSPADYEEALEQLKEIKKTKPRTITHRGVKEQSILNELNSSSFHVCDPCLPPCIGHDLFEGVVVWDLHSIIMKLVLAKWFTFDQINKRILNFNYYSSDLSNKPAPVNSELTKLSGHAVQNWCFLRLLPFILEGVIMDPSNEYWKLYLLLKKLVEYACAPAFSDSDIEMLDLLIKEYLTARAILDSPPKPKHHFMAHYPALIRAFGPLINLWTLRFESKHSFFKEVGRICKNFINLCITVAKKYQLFVAYVSTGSVLSEGISSRKELKEGDYEQFIVSELIKEFGSYPATHLHYECITINDINYKRGQYVLLEACNESNTEVNVGAIAAIVSVSSYSYFVLKVYCAVYQMDTGVHQINQEKVSIMTIKQHQLKYPVPHPVYDFGDFNLCFSLKFHLEN